MKKMVLLVSALLTFSAVAEKNNEVTFLNSKPSSKALPFSEAVKVGNLVFLSGQIGFNAQEKKLVSGGIKAEVHQTLKNIKNSLNTHGLAMNDVVKCTVMLTNINDFKQFNEIYVQYFTPPYPARSAFAVSDLALNSSVEVECIAAIK